MFARFSGLEPSEISRFQERMMNVKSAPSFSGVEPERENLTAALQQFEEIDPAFVVVCGDMVNEFDDKDQLALIRNTLGKYGETTPIHWVPGNHDIGVDNLTPDRDSVAAYRSEFGHDYYTFKYDESKFIVLNSVLLDRPENVPDEHLRQMDFLGDTLRSRDSRDSEHVVAFMHHPLFLRNAEESDSGYDWAPSPPSQPSGYWTVPLERRSPVVKLLREARVKTVFAGHMHRNHIASDNGLDVVVTSALGYPLGDDPSGYRVVDVSGGALSHRFVAL